MLHFVPRFMSSVDSSMIASSQSALAFARPVPATPALWCDSSERRHHVLQRRFQDWIYLTSKSPVFQQVVGRIPSSLRSAAAQNCHRVATLRGVTQKVEVHTRSESGLSPIKYSLEQRDPTSSGRWMKNWHDRGLSTSLLILKTRHLMKSRSGILNRRTHLEDEE